MLRSLRAFCKALLQVDQLFVLVFLLDHACLQVGLDLFCAENPAFQFFLCLVEMGEKLIVLAGTFLDFVLQIGESLLQVLFASFALIEGML